MPSRVNAAQLVQAAKDLLLEWDLTKTKWQDAKGREFEEKFLSELPQHVSRAAESIEEIDNLLRKIHSDCE
ncbi:MAG TPA: hypothetical protein PLS03_17555 [Terrimicrobiaceae bacterium]|nr:hypothetical protein [Terrimicrobiaceae bacterium]